jgi:hypothetical protein
MHLRAIKVLIYLNNTNYVHSSTWIFLGPTSGPMLTRKPMTFQVGLSTVGHTASRARPVTGCASFGFFQINRSTWIRRWAMSNVLVRCVMLNCSSSNIGGANDTGPSLHMYLEW